MGNYERRDRFYRKAKQAGLPSRASFKIAEILEKFPIVKAGSRVLDLGAAPGGWSVILAKAVGPQGKIFAVDLEKMTPKLPTNVVFYQGNLEAEETQAWLKEQLGNGRVQTICSDMSPKLTGIVFKDRFLSYELNLLAWRVAAEFLQPKGTLITKLFPGAEFEEFLPKLRKDFEKVKIFEPEASRKTSKEIYLLAMGYRG